MGQVYFFCGTQDKLLQMMKNKTILAFHAVQDKSKNRLKKKGSNKCCNEVFYTIHMHKILTWENILRGAWS